MIVGTAGHIDHGKTMLVRALTGIDTDRLAEEKARGISIELGYAYLPLADGSVLGFVDVPGHERFVHTMLSGATGIDFGLLVVAADDGIMPQTREHLNILALLGVERGAIALTKIDAAEANRVAEVVRAVRNLLAPTCLADSSVFPVSARTGQGVDALRRHLFNCSAQYQRKVREEHFRLAVDRSFSLPGIGTVVTGTVHSGEVHTGDHLALVPKDLGVRVRTIHAQNRPAQVGRIGERCALNLAGISHDAIRRGDWIVAPPIWVATERFDAAVRLLDEEVKPLVSGKIVHVHLGCTHLAGRIVVLESGADFAKDANQLAPGKEGLVQLTFQAPIGAWHGDRFILRDVTAKRTIGGGQVLDPFAPARYRRTLDRLAALAALRNGEPAARLGALVARAQFGVDLEQFTRAAKTREVDPLLANLSIRRITRPGLDVAVHMDRWESLQQCAVDALTKFHETHPDELGPDIARLRRLAFARWQPAIFAELIAELVATKTIQQSGPWLHRPEHTNEPSARERMLCQALLGKILKARFDPPWVRDLAKSAAQSEGAVRATLLRASRRGEAFQVVHDLFYHPLAVQDLATVAIDLQQSEGEITAAAFRDRIGLGRKRAIQILEFFDRVGFTRRIRDGHLVRPDGLFALGDRATDANKGATRALAIHENGAP